MAKAPPPSPARRRLLLLCWVCIGAYVGIITAIHILAFRAVAAGDEAFSTKDFDAFYAASMLLDRLPASALFDQTASAPIFHDAQQRLYGPLTAVQREHIPALRWYYPPSFLLAVAPLSRLPPIPAYLLWLTLTALPFLWVLRRALGGDAIAIPIGLAWPASFVNALFGQNGFLTAGLIGGGLDLLERRPLLAGTLFGLSTYKPHLALPVGLALLAGRQWRAIGAAVLSAAAMIALSTALFGFDAWIAFARQGSALARSALENGDNPWSIMPITFAALRVLGGSIGTAWAGQAVVSLGALTAIVWKWRRPGGPTRLKAAVLVVGGLLATPFGYIYDLTLLALPLAWLVTEANISGWRPFERLACVAGLLLPFAAAPFANTVGFQPGPLVLLGIFWVLLHRQPQCGILSPSLVKSSGNPL
jgi:hypothetical protein